MWISQDITINANVTKLKVCGKVSDTCNLTLVDAAGKVIKDSTGYVPKGLNIGDGDYLEFDIDLDTGKILNWKTPNFSEFFEG